MYAVFKVSKSWNHKFGPEFVQEGTWTESYDEALVFAEVLASEHADLIFAEKRAPFGIRYAACGNGRDKTGYMLRTSGGTDVYYLVKRVES